MSIITEATESLPDFDMCTMEDLRASATNIVTTTAERLRAHDNSPEREPGNLATSSITIPLPPSGHETNYIIFIGMIGEACKAAGLAVRQLDSGEVPQEIMDTSGVSRASVIVVCTLDGYSVAEAEAMQDVGGNFDRSPHIH